MYPILFEFGFVTIFSLWLFTMLGFIAGGLIFIRLAKRYRVKLSVLGSKGLIIIVWMLFISRMFFIIMHPDLYFFRFQFLNLFAIWDKGLSFWGAIAAWIYGIWYFSKKDSETSIAKLFDIMVPSILFGIALGSIGAFLDGINYGTVTELPWGVVFRSAHVKYISPIHPTQLYLTIYSSGIGIFLLWLLAKLRGLIPGFIAKAGVFLFCLFKFIEEFFRGDETPELFSLRIPQVIAFLIMIFAGYLIYKQNDPQNILRSIITKYLNKKPKHGIDANETHQT